MTAPASAGSEVARIREVLEGLVRQRQLMRDRAENAPLLEANRLGIIYWQRRLSRALVAEQRVDLRARGAAREPAHPGEDASAAHAA